MEIKLEHQGLTISIKTSEKEKELITDIKDINEKLIATNLKLIEQLKDLRRELNREDFWRD